jgi:hypothetical protein
MSQVPPPGDVPGLIQPGEPPKSNNTVLIIVIVAACCLGACLIIPIGAAILIPNLIKNRQAANESVAIGTLRVINTAEALYREADRGHNNKLVYAKSLKELRDADLIDPVLASGTKHGYVFSVESKEDLLWSATAVPQSPGKTGDRSFFIDESGVIRYRQASQPGTAGPSDTPVGR